MGRNAEKGIYVLFLFSHSIVSSSLRPHGLQHARLPVLHHFPDFAQTYVHWVNNAIQPSHPLSPPCPPALNLSQHQGLFQWVDSSHQVAKVLEFQLQRLYLCLYLYTIYTCIYFLYTSFSISLPPSLFLFFLPFFLFPSFFCSIVYRVIYYEKKIAHLMMETEKCYKLKGLRMGDTSAVSPLPSPRTGDDARLSSTVRQREREHPFLLLPPSIFPSSRVFSNESALRIRWPKY